MPVLIPPRLSPATLIGLFGFSGFPTFHSMILVLELLPVLVINPILPPEFWNPPLEIFVVPPLLVVIPPMLPLLSIVMLPELLVILSLIVPLLLRLSTLAPLLKFFLFYHPLG